MQLWHPTDMHYWDAWQAIIESSLLFNGKPELEAHKEIAAYFQNMVDSYTDFAKSFGFNRIYFFREMYADVLIRNDVDNQEYNESELLQRINDSTHPLVNFANTIPSLDTSKIYGFSPILYCDV